MATCSTLAFVRPAVDQTVIAVPLHAAPSLSTPRGLPPSQSKSKKGINFQDNFKLNLLEVEVDRGLSQQKMKMSRWNRLRMGPRISKVPRGPRARGGEGRQTKRFRVAMTFAGARHRHRVLRDSVLACRGQQCYEGWRGHYSLVILKGMEGRSLVT